MLSKEGMMMDKAEILGVLGRFQKEFLWPAPESLETTPKLVTDSHLGYASSVALVFSRKQGATAYVYDNRS